jgi:antitoxin CptB
MDRAQALLSMSSAMPRTQRFIDERALSKLRWRCRRGLLENDLFIERFFNEHGEQVTVSEAQGLDDLMDLSDNDLLDLLLQRKHPKSCKTVVRRRPRHWKFSTKCADLIARHCRLKPWINPKKDME